MIRTLLRYHRPATPSEASGVLAEHHGNVAVLGGGTQLLPRMNRDEVHVEHVVDLHGLGLDRISVAADRVEIGARVTYADVLAHAGLGTVVPLLPRVARGITGGRQLTQQATLVGSACHNYPGTDVPGVLVALGATVRLHGTAGVREVAAADFLRGACEVDVRPGEFVSSFVVGRRSRSGYCKIKHCSGSWPIATASAVLDEATGRLAVTLGAVAATPVRIELDAVPDDTTELDEQVRAAVTAPWSDVLAPGSYRRAVAGVVARRAVTELMEVAS
jgi:aerobic carbon-monoxide dehydrogenase medium subunit